MRIMMVVQRTFEECVHVDRASQFERRSAGVGRDCRVSPARQQQTDYLQVVVVHGVVYRSEMTDTVVSHSHTGMTSTHQSSTETQW